MKHKNFHKPKHVHTCPGFKFKGIVKRHKSHVVACFNPHCQIQPNYPRLCGILVDALQQGVNIQRYEKIRKERRERD